jgi:hypothetical protein
MADETGPALGLSIGATNLAAVTGGHALTRKPVLTLYRQRPPEVGVPGENPRLDEPGVAVTGFVNRVGSPAGIVATDGSVHRSEALVADGLRALAYAATGGHALPEGVAVTYPSHWSAKAADDLGAALSRVSEWSSRGRPLILIPDAAATLFAVRADPGIPGRGTVAVCDFGGTGTSITLMDAAGDYHALGPTVRHHDFSGDLIDQALLSAVMANMPSSGSFDSPSTLAIGALGRLRAGSRSAKEQLSSSTVTTLPADPAGMRGELRLTRNELDDAIRQSLHNFLAVLDETLVRNGIRDLAAVVAVGGGANIPAVTIMLSAHLRVPVVTTPRPHLTAAFGAELRAARGADGVGATASSPAIPATASNPAVPARATAAAPVSAPWPAATATGKAMSAGPAWGLRPPLAWSQTGGDSASMPTGTAVADQTAARPAPKVEESPSPAAVAPEAKRRWFRRPVVAIAGTAIALLLAATVVAMALSFGNRSVPGAGTTGAPSAPPTNAAAPPPATGAPNLGPSAPPTQEAPPPAPDAGPPATADAPAPAPADAPPPPQAPLAAAAPAGPLIPRIPQIPPIPGLNEPIPGLGRINQIIPGFGGPAIGGVDQILPRQSWRSH